MRVGRRPPPPAPEPSWGGGFGDELCLRVSPSDRPLGPAGPWQEAQDPAHLSGWLGSQLCGGQGGGPSGKPLSPGCCSSAEGEGVTGMGFLLRTGREAP